MIESEFLSIRIFLVNFTLKIGQEKYLLLIALKTNPWTKDINGEIIIGSFYEKELLRSKL